MKKAIAIFLVFAMLLPASALLSAAERIPAVITADDSWDGTTQEFTEGNGDESDPFIIDTAEKLAYFAQVYAVANDCTGRWFSLEKNLDMTGYEWIPVGYDTVESANRAFSGNFGGNGYSVMNISITQRYFDSASNYFSGFFGVTGNSCTISGLKLVGADINITVSGNATDDVLYAGILAGISYSAITGCYVSGEINASVENGTVCAGGLVSYHSTQMISKCYSEAVVSSNSTTIAAYSGGLVSQVYGSADIVNCYATGNVSATANGGTGAAGGLVAALSDGDISQCYAIGNTSSNALNAGAGGLVGGTAGGTISNCFAAGNVSALSNNRADSGAGRLVGAPGDNNVTTIDNCYVANEQTIARTESYSEGGNGCDSSTTNFRQTTEPSNTLGTSVEIANFTSQEYVPTTLRWDFADVWVIVPTSNYAYPQLICQPTDVPVTGITSTETDITVSYSPTVTYDGIFSVIPENATNKDISYEVTSGTDVISVDATTGKIAVLKVGNATVTATTSDGGFSTSVNFTIEKAQREFVLCTVASKTDTTVTINPANVSGDGDIKYICIAADEEVPDTGWQSELVFTGLERNTNYRIYVKTENGVNYVDSIAEGPLVVTDKTAIGGTVAVNGTTQYGQTLTAAPSITPDDATYTYKWYNGDNEIVGATGAEYVVTTDDIGAEISVSVIATDDFTGTVTSENVVPEKAERTASAPTAGNVTDSSVTLDAASVTGDGTVYYGYADTDSIDEVDNWQESTIFEGLSRNTTYYFFMKVTGGVNYVDAASSGTAVLTLKTDITGTVEISGNAEYGNVLTATPDITPDTATYTYQWYRNGNAIDGEVNSEYTVATDDISSSISVGVIANGNFNGTVLSASVSPTKADRQISAPTAAVVTDSSVTLDAVTVDGDGDISYGYATINSVGSVEVWQESVSFTGLSRNTTYYFFAKVTGGENYIDVSSDATEVKTLKTAISGSVVITGKAQFDSVLTAEASILPDDATYSYQWLRGDVEIEGAVNSEYRAAAEDIGQTLTVKIIATDGFEGTVDADEGVAISKASGTIAAPALDTATDSSITVTAATVVGDGEILYGISTEDSVDSVEAWQTELSFTGLSRNTSYYIFAKVGETSYYTGAQSVALEATTAKTAISGTLEISGAVEYSKTVSVTNNIIPDGATFTYQWYRDGGIIVGETNAQYTVTEGDIGHEISVSAIADDSFEGTITSDSVVAFKIDVTGVSVNKSSNVMNIGSKYQLKATIAPIDATVKNVSWTSSNPGVASVGSDGLVTAVAKGTAVITATTADKAFTATCRITVAKFVSKIELSADNLNINFKSSGRISATITPSDATAQSIIWTSDNTNVATVDGGTVRAVKTGTATITATITDADGTVFTDTCKVTVQFAWWQWIIRILLFGWIWYN